MNVDIAVVKLLCSRLCHDLVGPAGAVHNGMELIEEMGGEGGGALDMVASSVDQLSARLGFFRMAFGLGGLSGRKPPLAEAMDLADAYFRGGRTAVDWSAVAEPDPVRGVPTPVIKLMLNMILVAADALPRGGVLAVTLARMDDGRGNPGHGLAVRASGEGARLKEELQAALVSPRVEGTEKDLNAHNVHGFFCRQLARELGCEVELSVAADDVQFAVLVPEPDDR